MFDLVRFGENVDSEGGYIYEYMVAFVKGVEVSVGVLATTLEVLSADETGVDVDVGKGDRTKLLKVEIEEVAID